MKTFISLGLFVVGALAQMTINTPANVVECQPTLLTWSGGTAPYYLSILPGANPSGTAVENLGQQNSTSLTWICNLPSGSSIGLTLVDSTGLTAQTAPFTINPGSTTSCVNTTSVVPGPTTSAVGSTATHATTSAAAGSSSAKASTGAVTTTSASPSASSGAAYANVVRVGAAGVAGAAVAALLF